MNIWDFVFSASKGAPFGFEPTKISVYSGPAKPGHSDDFEMNCERICDYGQGIGDMTSLEKQEKCDAFIHKKSGIKKQKTPPSSPKNESSMFKSFLKTMNFKRKGGTKKKKTQRRLKR